MHDAWRLPTAIELQGKEYAIRTDFRAILDIIAAQNDPELTDEEKIVVLLEVLYKDQVPAELLEEACRKAGEFIDAGMGEHEDKKPPSPRLMDWEQDAPILIPAINKVLGTEVRMQDYVHWYTFLGAYMEIGEGLFASVVSYRNKKAKGKKLEKWDQEFYRSNKRLIDLKVRKPERDEQEKDELRELFGFKK